MLSFRSRRLLSRQTTHIRRIAVRMKTPLQQGEIVTVGIAVFIEVRVFAAAGGDRNGRSGGAIHEQIHIDYSRVGGDPAVGQRDRTVCLMVVT